MTNENQSGGPLGGSRYEETVAPPTSILSAASKLAPRFHALFAGLERAHGCYDITGEQDNGKQVGKALTKREAVTDGKWAAHLAGEAGIGIVPIRDDSTCVFGAVDVDQYSDLDPGRVAATLARLELPLIPCRSKSGGIHLYLFTQAPVPASKMQVKLRDIASLLGFGQAEVFPKQRTLMPREVGGWINACYFDAEHTTRYAVNVNGDAMSAEEFLTTADAAKVGPEFFDKSVNSGSEHLPDGPPCLQHLIALGFPPGTRNNGLFNLGVYAKRSNPDGWKTDIEEFNRNFMTPPLTHSEIGDTIKSLSRKTYAYKCNEHPIASYCNAGMCKLRRFGIGSTGESMPVLGALTKYDSTPPLWWWDVDGQRIELTTDELLDYSRFTKACLDRLNKILPDLKAKEWKQCVAKALDTLQVEPVPEDASTEGQFWELVEHFCTSRAQAHSREELVLSKPYTDHAEGRTYFRLAALLNHLDRLRFRYFNPQKITSVLKARGGQDHQFKIRGKCVRAWSVPAFPTLTGELPVPDSICEQGPY